MAHHNLPTQPTPFVGRTAEIEEVNKLLFDPACRLLTLVGPGGIGKTRLALETARQAAANRPHDYPNGVYFIPLQALASPDLLVTAIANSADFQFFQGGKPYDQLLDFLANKRLLLVLDNMEHLLAGSALISDILAHAPGVKVLVTSREALNLQEEWIYTVNGMRVPTTSELESIESFSAVRLFVQHARRINPAFSLDTERAGISRICSLVGGMPLGIELAAAWVRAMSCDEIADEIARNLSILATSARNIPERHRTMLSVLQQSWELLTPEEQQVIMGLAVFQGGFTREAAEAVATVSLPVLSSLVDKSWLQWDSTSRRYDVHELLRQYAEEQLTRSAAADSARDAHTAYFATWMKKREADIKFRRQDEALDDIERDFANVRLAWHWAAGQHNSDLINLMLEALNFYADMRARFVEGKELFEAAADHFAHFNNDTAELTYYRLRLRRARQIILGSLVDTGERSELATEIKSIGKALEPFSSSADTAFSLLQTGMTLFLQEKYVDTRTYLEQAMQLYEQIDDPFYLADTINFVGLTNPEPEEVLDSYRRSLAIQQHIGDKNGIGWTLSHLARVSYLLHRYADGENYARQAIALQRQRNDRKGLSFSMIVGCLWAFRRGEWEEALEMAEEGLKLAQNLNISFFLKSALANLGLILIITEVDFERGEALCLQVNNEDINYIATATEAYSDALNGLVISNYMRGDAEATQRYFHNIPGSIQHKWGSITLMDRLYSVLSGILVLDMQGKTELALEVTALALTLPDPPGVVPLVWFRNWALIQRLCQRWRQELGDERYEAAWQRGTRRDISATIELLISGLDGAEVAPPPLPVTEPSTVQLTEREQEILGLLAAGLSNREIAAKLVFSLGTVKWYANQIYGKLGVGSRTQAIARARELHILS